MSHPLLSRGFEPIRFECDYAHLVVEGRLPSELRGTLYRIGPNPQFRPRGEYNPLQADGMIHAFRIGDGRVAYRNRWVRTRQWQREREAGRALFATSGNPAESDPSVVGTPTNGVANTNLVWHAGALLALEEGHAPIRIDPVTLDTLGPWTFGGALTSNMTAHPKLDPAIGEMVLFANFPNRRFDGALAVYVADSTGRIVRQERIVGPYAALVHDFAITREYIVFVVCPVTLSLDRLRAGRSPIAWEPDRQTHVGVVSRSSGAVSWYAHRACMAWHTLNAYDTEDGIVLDLCVQAAAAFPSPDGNMAPSSDLRQYLTRWTLKHATEGSDPSVSCLSDTRLSQVVCEYPRIDERRMGQRHRHGYVAAVGGPGTDDPFHRAIGHFDFDTGDMSLWHAGSHCAVSEPIFVPRAPDAPEGDGWLLATVFDERRNASHLAVLDAARVAEGPIARAHLDHRVPMGFHGTFIPN